MAAAKSPPINMITIGDGATVEGAFQIASLEYGGQHDRRAESGRVPTSQTTKITTAPRLAAPAGEIPRTRSSVMCSDTRRIESSDVTVNNRLWFMGCSMVGSKRTHMVIPYERLVDLVSPVRRFTAIME